MQVILKGEFKMKKILITFLTIIFAVSILFLSVSCKGEAGIEETAAAETTEAAETTAVETEASVEETAEEDIFSEPAELVFWWYGEQEIPGVTAYVDALCAEYNKLHPNITVKQVHQPGDAVVSNFLAAAAANSGPDIATMWGGIYNLEQFWAGVAAPVSDYVSEEEMSHWIGKKYSTYDGKVWASDMFANGMPYLYNAEYFEQVGLDTEKPPQTWEELMEASGKLKAAGIQPMTVGWVGGYQFVTMAGDLIFQYVTVQDIKEMVVGTKKFTDSPGLLEVFKKIDEYNRAGYFLDAGMSLDQFGAFEEFRKGAAGIASSTPLPLFLSWVDDVGPDKYKYIPVFPKFADAKYPLPGPPAFVFSEFITSWSPNKELAADFLVFMHSQKSLELAVEILKGNLMPVDDRYDPGTIADPLKREIAEMMMESFKGDSTHFDMYLPYAITGENMSVVAQQLILGEVTPEEAVELVEQNAQVWREQNPEYVENFKKWIEE